MIRPLNLSHMTFTGVDERTDLHEVTQLSRQIPCLEWGFLYSPKRAGTPGRYPSVDFLKKAFTDLPAGPDGVRVALHLCGDSVNHLLLHARSTAREFVDLVAARGGRVQLNFNQVIRPINLGALASLMQAYPQTTFITQDNFANVGVRKALKELEVTNHAVLFDASGGRGVLCTDWPAPHGDIPCGYAGGLGPKTIGAALEQIAEKVGDACIWTDKEGQIRSADTDGVDWFDLVAVHACLRQAMASKVPLLMRSPKSADLIRFSFEDPPEVPYWTSKKLAGEGSGISVSYSGRLVDEKDQVLPEVGHQPVLGKSTSMGPLIPTIPSFEGQPQHWPGSHGYTVLYMGGCRFIFGQLPLNDIGLLQLGMPEDAVIDPDLADLTGATIVSGAPDALRALDRRALQLSAERRRDADNAMRRGNPSLAEWLAYGRRGLSSNALAKQLYGLPADAGDEHPIDPADLQRCLDLLEATGTQERIGEMAQVSTAWWQLTIRWTELTALLESERQEGLTSWTAPLTFELMRDILKA